MKIRVFILRIVSLSLAGFSVSASVKVDSYLDAYENSHGKLENGLDTIVKKSDREYNTDPQTYPVYKPPSGQYGSHVDLYGPLVPAPQYGPPAAHYSPPVPQYGPPSAVYGPPATSSVQVFYGMPHAMLSIWDKLKWKLDLFTIGKILLKFVIFKKIVSLIAILCLLLFIPSLKHNKIHHGSSSENEDEDDMMRRFKTQQMTGDQILNNVSLFALKATEELKEVYATTVNLATARLNNTKKVKGLRK